MFREVQKFVNLDYEKDARGYDKVDCYGLCYLYNKDILKKEIPQYASYQTDQDNYVRVRNGKEKSGDILMFNIMGYPIHVGVVVQPGVMLHIMEDSKSKIESYFCTKWQNRLDSIWRYEGIK